MLLTHDPHVIPITRRKHFSSSSSSPASRGELNATERVGVLPRLLLRDRELVVEAERMGSSEGPRASGGASVGEPGTTYNTSKHQPYDW